MASAINYNTVWTSIFEPLSTFAFLKRYGRLSAADRAARPAVPRGRLGRGRRGAAGRRRASPSGSPATRWSRTACRSSWRTRPATTTRMLDPQQRIWGFETNFGGLAELAVVKANQLMPKPAPPHLGGGGQPGAGQLHRVPAARLAPRRADEAGRRRADLGRLRRARLVRHPARPQRRRDPGLRGLQPGEGGAVPAAWAPSWSSTGRPRTSGSGRTSTPRTRPSGSGFGERIRELTGGDDPDIVFEHPGRETFGASVFVAKRGGTIVTCASTSGFQHQYDNRYLWMNLKRIIGSHFANYREAWEANRLVARGRIHPTLSKTLPAGADRPGRLRGAPQRAPGQGRRALPRPDRGTRRPRPASCGRGT